MTPQSMGVSGIMPPPGGWKPHTFYEIEVAYRPTNIIHRAIFYSGFLHRGEPAGHNAVWLPTYDGQRPIQSAYYAKVITELPFQGEL